MEINVAQFLASLLIMLKGMVGIFVVIGIIFLSTLVLNKVFKGK
jgi:hypothetical protein